MKTLRANFKMISMCWHGSKAWVIMNTLNLIINPIRNLMIEVLFIGSIYNMINRGEPFEKLIPYFVVIAVFYLLTSLYEGLLYTKVEVNGSQKIQRYINSILCENAADMELAAFDNAEFYEEKVFAVENCVEIAKKAVNNTASFFAFSIGGLLSIGLISGIEPLMIGFILISILFSTFLSRRQNKINLSFKEKQAGMLAKEDYIQRVFYGKEYAKELRSYPELAEMNLDLFEKTEKENKKLAGAYGIRTCAVGLLSVFNSRTIMYWCVMLLMVLIIRFRGNIEPGNLVIMTQSIATAALLIGAVTYSVTEMVNIRDYQKKISHFFEYSERRRRSMGSKKIDKIESIEFEHVSFTYPEEKNQVLKDISFKAVVGEQLVIVGLNGSGKSTIIKLLMGFYNPDLGRILINGTDMRELDIDHYLSKLSCVFQDVVPYAFSVEGNISTDLDELDEKRLKKVLHDVCLDGVIDEKTLKNEMTREFTEDGAVFSGGVLQKIALARALYKNASLMLLDETTSAVDPESEMQIIESIERASADRIIVQISHKLSNVKKGSRIIYIEDGRIAESGTHSELIGRKGKYYELFLYQAEKFKRSDRINTLKNEVWS